jgi:folate-binding protein YgfZ
VIALLRLRQTEEAIYALLPVDLLERVATHLRRFVLRAKVNVEIAADLQPAWMSSVAQSGSTDIIAFDYAADRRVVATPGTSSRAVTGPSLAPPVSGIEDEWWSADIAAGLPQVFHASSAVFVPQMLNLDLLDGISFSKGCYTGQEIVARTQHLGRIKRRTFRYLVANGPLLAPLASGLTRDGTKVAEVVLSARRADHVEVLAVTSLEARGRTLRTEDGREAVVAEMPYPIGDRG